MQSQFTTNANTANTALGQEDKTLSTINTTIGQILSEASTANDSALTDTQRQAIAAEIQSQRDTLLSLANTTDGTGNFIFGGHQNTSPPFSNNPNGVGAVYNGDQGTTSVQISPQRQIAINDPGSSIFLTSVPGASLPDPDRVEREHGLGHDRQRRDHAIGRADQCRSVPGAVPERCERQPDLHGPGPDAGRHAAGPGAASLPQPFKSGQAIPLGAGQTLTINGTPAAGDEFGVSPPTATQSNVFTTIDNLISTLQTPTGGNASLTNLSNQLTTFQTQLTNSQTTVQTVNASVGARETEVNAMKHRGDQCEPGRLDPAQQPGRPDHEPDGDGLLRTVVGADTARGDAEGFRIGAGPVAVLDDPGRKAAGRNGGCRHTPVPRATDSRRTTGRQGVATRAAQDGRWINRYGGGSQTG